MPVIPALALTGHTHPRLGHSELLDQAHRGVLFPVDGGWPLSIGFFMHEVLCGVVGGSETIDLRSKGVVRVGEFGGRYSCQYIQRC